MFVRLLFVTVATALAALPACALADSRSDLVAMSKAFYALKSFHGDIDSGKGRKVGIDFVAPDRFRETLPGGQQAVVIGNDMWMQVGGRQLKLPGIVAGMRTYLDQIRTLSLNGDIEKNYDITDDGPATLNGVATHTYTLIKHGDTVPVKLWIGGDSLPIQEVVTTKDGTSTVRYSQFNAHFAIDAP